MLRGRGRGAGRGGRLGEADGGEEAAGAVVGDAGLFRGAGVGADLEDLVALGGGRRLGSTGTFPIWIGSVSNISGYFRETWSVRDFFFKHYKE